MEKDMCTNTELQDQIVALAKQNADEHKIIVKTLDAWTPLMTNYEKELTRSKAYKLVADDLRDKGADWKFWVGLLAAVLTVLSAIFVLAEKIKMWR